MEEQKRGDTRRCRLKLCGQEFPCQPQSPAQACSTRDILLKLCVRRVWITCFTATVPTCQFGLQKKRKSKNKKPKKRNGYFICLLRQEAFLKSPLYLCLAACLDQNPFFFWLVLVVAAIGTSLTLRGLILGMVALIVAMN